MADDDARPGIRAGVTRAFVRELRALDPTMSGAILQRVDAPILAQIEAKMALSWIEFEQHVALVEAANALMGPDASREMWRKIINDTMGMPILRGFAAAVLRLRRNDPAALVSQAQRVYGHLTRGVGRVHYEPHPDAGGGDLVLTGFPGDRFPTSAYFIGLCGCSHALLDAREISASVELADMQALGCRIRTRWSGPVGGPLERD